MLLFVVKRIVEVEEKARIHKDDEVVTISDERCFPILKVFKRITE
jgi:hypothetical protein